VPATPNKGLVHQGVLGVGKLAFERGLVKELGVVGFKAWFAPDAPERAFDAPPSPFDAPVNFVFPNLSNPRSWLP
jgi:hypothetical protein